MLNRSCKYPCQFSIVFINILDIFVILGQHKTTKLFITYSKTMKIQKTCYMCLIFTLLNREMVLMEMDHMSCKMFMMKYTKKIRKRMLMVI